MSKLTFASFFTGIAGFEKGWSNTDEFNDPAVMVEWNAACQKILTRHYPNVPLLGDITDVTGTQIGPIDGFVGGFPCQGTSVGAPHRLGLADERSSHYFEFIRLLSEYQRLVDELRPRWVVIENPVGLLSSPGVGKDKVDRRGWDMAAVIRGLEDLGYGWAYRVVDGRHLGTPQVRKRVIVVGHRGGDPRPAWQVLGDTGAGGEASSPSDDRLEDAGHRAGPFVGAGGDLIRVWRKSANPRVAITKGYDGGYRETWVDDGTNNTLTGYDQGNATRQKTLISQHGRLRTLTLTEWERLQGFPDGWTEGVSDSDRYTLLGNAMHVGMAEWLGHNIAAVNASLPLIGATA